MTKKERDHLNKVASLGCIVCGNPAQIHHIRKGTGMGRRASHIGGTIPLCPWHHLDGGFGVAYHAGPREWEKNFDTEENYLREVERRLSCLRKK